jgi:hypothetical protein
MQEKPLTQTERNQRYRKKHPNRYRVYMRRLMRKLRKEKRV